MVAALRRAIQLTNLRHWHFGLTALPWSDASPTADLLRFCTGGATTETILKRSPSLTAALSGSLPRGPLVPVCEEVLHPTSPRRHVHRFRLRRQKFELVFFTKRTVGKGLDSALDRKFQRSKDCTN